MKNKGGIILLMIAFLGISVYFLFRTWKVNQIRDKAEAFAMQSDGNIDRGMKQRYLDSLWKQEVLWPSTTLEDLSKQELGLGLDLQGGMSVILEVSPTEIVRSLASSSRDTRVNQAIDAAQKRAVTSSSSFVDLFVEEFKKLTPNTSLASVFANSSNRGELSFNSTDSEVASYIQTEFNGAFDRAFNIIQTRVDKFGVSNPNLQRLPGTNRIQVELPGVDNPQRVRKLLSGSAKLEFCEVVNLQEVSSSFDGLSAILTQMDIEERINNATTSTAASPAATTDTTSNSLAAQLAQTATDSTGTDSLSQANAFSNIFVGGSATELGVRVKDTTRINAILKRPDVKGLFPKDVSFVYDVNSVFRETTNEDVVDLYMVRDLANAPLEGDVVTNASQDYDERGRPAVDMQMNAEGARKWKNLTAANVGRRIAIILDNFVYSAPNVNGEIGGGRSSISGNFSVEEAQDLANVLKAGKLPAPTNIIEEAVVGATVGEKAVKAGVISSLVGLLAVLIFVLVYYNQAGWIANVALLVNLVLLLGVMASFGATLTLPGIAGMVLSVGMSVDANVLIYERVKEELNEGKPFPLAISNGFKFAMPSIIDSNVTTLITGIILFIFGTGLILGFATTLLIGIFTSLFCAIFISRLIFDRLLKKDKTVKFFTAWSERLFKDTAIDFVTRRRVFYMISGAIIIAGAISIGIKGFGLGVDFKGGRTYVVQFEETANTAAIEKALSDTFEGEPIEVKTYGGFDQVKVTTPYKIDNIDTDVERKIEEDVKTAVASVDGNAGTVTSSSRVGPTIANDTIWSALKAIFYSLIVTFIYILIRFRSVAFSVGAVVAVFHDVLVILGIFSIFNGILPFSLDVDQAFVGAVLTLMGYSMNDTVVVFDRVREYLNEKKNANEPIANVINNALNSTLSRTAVTGIATLLVLLILLVFGGESIRGFIFAMFLGVIVGTYSSLFVAAPIVVDSMQRQLAREAKKPIVPEVVAVPVEVKKGKK